MEVKSLPRLLLQFRKDQSKQRLLPNKQKPPVDDNGEGENVRTVNTLPFRWAVNVSIPSPRVARTRDLNILPLSQGRDGPLHRNMTSPPLSLSHTHTYNANCHQTRAALETLLRPSLPRLHPATGTEPTGPIIPIFLAEPALITLTVFLSFSDVPLSHPRASSDSAETEGRREREDGDGEQSFASPHQPALRASPAGGRQKEISYLVASMTLHQSSATPFSGGRGCTATPSFSLRSPSNRSMVCSYGQ